MTEATHTPLPPQHDGEPDLASEIARLDLDIKALAEQLAPTEAELKASIKSVEMSDADYAKLIADLDGMISDDERSKAPANASRLDQLMWHVTTAANSLKRPTVPATDAKRPTLETPAEDFSTLPAHARMARGYAA